MTKLRGKVAGTQASGDHRKRGVVICITSGARERTPQISHKAASQAPVITQERLAEGLRLHKEEVRIAQALREFRLQVEAELLAGSEVEGGDLAYDAELKIVRRNTNKITVSG